MGKPKDLFVQPIKAGGPGSGRKPGFGEGQHPGGRPFGVKTGLHKVLTDSGYKFKASTISGRGGRQAIYDHADGQHRVRVDEDGKWSHAGDRGAVPRYQAVGDTATGLKQSLDYRHAGGPKPGIGVTLIGR